MCFYSRHWYYVVKLCKLKDHSVVYIDSALIPEDTRAQNDKSVEKYKPRQYNVYKRITMYKMLILPNIALIFNVQRKI